MLGGEYFGEKIAGFLGITDSRFEDAVLERKYLDEIEKRNKQDDLENPSE